jgi:hypothetical protein
MTISTAGDLGLVEVSTVMKGGIHVEGAAIAAAPGAFTALVLDFPVRDFALAVFSFAGVAGIGRLGVAGVGASSA